MLELRFKVKWFGFRVIMNYYIVFFFDGWREYINCVCLELFYWYILVFDVYDKRKMVYSFIIVELVWDILLIFIKNIIFFKF